MSGLRPSWLWRAAVPGILLYLVLAVAAFWRFTTDDAYISLQYARNLAAGNGLSWTPGRVVEGYSNFLYVLLGAGAERLGIEGIAVFKAVSIGAVLLSGLLLYRLARYWLSPRAALLPVVVTLCYSGTLWWAVSGLETGLYQCLCLLALLLAVAGLGDRPDQARGRLRPGLLGAAGIAAMLAALTRFEGPVLAAAVVGGLILEGLPALGPASGRRDGPGPPEPRRTIVAAAAFSLPFLALYLPYTAFRLATFGRLLPNSVACKELLRWSSENALWDTLIFLPLAVGAVIALRGLRDAKSLILALLVLAYLPIVAKVDPVVGYFNRYFLPALGPLAVLGTAGLAAMLPERGRLVGSVAAAAIALVAVCYLPPLWQAAGFYAERQAMRERMAAWLAADMGRDDRVAAGDVGLIGYRLDGRIIDLFCLNAPEFARPPLNGDVAAVADDVLRRRPRFIVLNSADPAALRPFDGYGVYAALARHPGFRAGYGKAATFIGPRRQFNYYVFKRNATD